MKNAEWYTLESDGGFIYTIEDKHHVISSIKIYRTKKGAETACLKWLALMQIDAAKGAE